MNPVVFLGPSLDIEQARRLGPALEFRPPVCRGDVYRVVSEGTAIVGIVDGELDQALPVWHKEILWALSQGARVFGAASIGALRAVELGPFGMVGLGRIFEWYRDGVLEDDDELVVLHAPAEKGYRPISEAMVNLRATLQHAGHTGILSGEVAARLIAFAKALHYAERSVLALRARADRDPDLRSSLGDLWEHWDELRVDVKAEDARLLVQHVMKARKEGWAEPSPRPPFDLAQTSAWEAFLVQHAPRPGEPRARPAGQLSEVMLAYHRALALHLARGEGNPADSSAVQAVSEAFRRRRGLLGSEAARQWLATQKMTVEQFSELMYEETLAASMGSRARGLALAQLERIRWLVGRDSAPASALVDYARAIGLVDSGAEPADTGT